jgi:dTDP-4-dehydrorhamnose reductase
VRRLLVTGAGGMVGAYVADVFAGWDLVLTDIVAPFERLDVRHADEVARVIASHRPDLVLHLAAETDVDACELDPSRAQRSNALGTRHVARACGADIPLVYISTASVFDGEKAEPYVETDRPAPVNHYARGKLAGEEAVVALVRHYTILRAGWMIGGGARDKKFVGQLARLIAAGRTPLRVVNDTWGSPVYARDLLGTARRLVDGGHRGLYHAANDGAATRFEIALLLREALGRPDIEVVPVSSKEFPQAAPRPRSEAVRCEALARLGLALRPWQEAVRDYVVSEIAPRLTAA